MVSLDSTLRLASSIASSHQVDLQALLGASSLDSDSLEGLSSRILEVVGNDFSPSRRVEGQRVAREFMAERDCGIVNESDLMSLVDDYAGALMDVYFLRIGF